MKKIAFDNDKYLKMQSKHILERISNFDNKLYLEFGGKLFDDHHAARVLPGFQPDSKLKMLLKLKEKVEIVIAVNARVQKLAPCFLDINNITKLPIALCLKAFFILFFYFFILFIML